ncbi:MAG: hypothetical protein FWD53_07905, partial [Phycisphaerales bacterium]|nr:hypothetical protein [Phycisphaerales bacterium]
MTKEEIIFKVLQAVWLTTSAVLIVVLHVYRGRGLAKAPVRESTLTLGSSIALAGGVFFLYLCSQAIAFAVAKAMLPGGGRGEGGVRSIQMMVNISA